MYFRFTPSVAAYAKRQGLDIPTLQDMVQKSALVSHEKGNRRYHEWVFLVQNGMVKWMAPFASSTEKDTIHRPHPTPGPGEFLVWEECEDCEGEGCKFCDFEGDRPVIRRLHNPRRER